MRQLINLLSFYSNLFLAFIFWRSGKGTLQGKELGNPGASWWVPDLLLSKMPLVYSGGVGEDISFDLAIEANYNATVYTFDPTPKAIAYIATQDLPKRVHFLPIGLWKSNRNMRFFSPKSSSSVSHSILNLQNTADYFEAKCYTLSTLQRVLGHNKIDLLKIDIEGAEYAVLNDMLQTGIKPNCICVEFDQPTTFRLMWTMVQKLHQAGYSLEKRSYFNFTFVLT